MRQITVAVSAAVAAVAMGTPSQAVVAGDPFQITVSFGSGLTTSQQSVFAAASSFWESLITGYAYTVPSLSGLTISASGVAIDGVGGVLGSAGPQTGFYNNSAGTADYVYVSTGQMQFDTADLANMESNGSLFSVIVHEMAHVIGFGTLWTYIGAYVNGSGHYTGEAALAAYQAECDANATYVPVELDGGSGTANGHWDETWACGSNALMTGYLNMPVTMDYTTVASFADLGYLVVDSLPSVPVPMSLPLIASGVGALAMMRRRKQAAA